MTDSAVTMGLLHAIKLLQENGIVYKVPYPILELSRQTDRVIEALTASNNAGGIDALALAYRELDKLESLEKQP